MTKIQDNNNYHKSNINWYPGHMAKTKRQIIEDMKLIDIVVEIIDSRIPISSQNPEIKEITSKKKKIIILNKCDLADKNQNEKWVKYFETNGQLANLTDCNIGIGIKETISAIEKSMQEELIEYSKKGRIGRKIRAMVIRNTKCGKIIIYK